MAIVPDSKNWTWVFERACPECGFDSGEVAYEDITELIRADVDSWTGVVHRPDARGRARLRSEGSLFTVDTLAR